MEQQESSFFASENEEWYSYFGRQFSNFLIKLNILLLYQPATVLPGMLSAKRIENLCPQKKTLHKNVYSSMIHNCQNLEATKMPFSSGRRHKYTAVHPDNRILFTNKKKGAIKP